MNKILLRLLCHWVRILKITIFRGTQAKKRKIAHTGGGRDKVKWFRFKKWYIYSRWKVLLWCANDSLVLNLNFATVRPKKGGKSTTNGQKYWKFHRFKILKMLVKIMVFHGQKSAFSKLEFSPHDMRSLWLHRSTLFEAPKHAKLCENVL